MKFSRLYFLIPILFLACKSPEVRKPVKVVSGSYINESVERNKQMVAEEEAFIKDYKAIPLVTQMKEGPGQITTYKFEDYSHELAKENEIIRQDPNFSFEYCIKIWNQTFPEFSY